MHRVGTCFHMHARAHACVRLCQCACARALRMRVGCSANAVATHASKANAQCSMHSVGKKKGEATASVSPNLASHMCVAALPCRFKSTMVAPALVVWVCIIIVHD